MSATTTENGVITARVGDLEVGDEFVSYIGGEVSRVLQTDFEFSYDADLRVRYQDVESGYCWLGLGSRVVIPVNASAMRLALADV